MLGFVVLALGTHDSVWRCDSFYFAQPTPVKFAQARAESLESAKPRCGLQWSSARGRSIPVRGYRAPWSPGYSRSLAGSNGQGSEDKSKLHHWRRRPGAQSSNSWERWDYGRPGCSANSSQLEIPASDVQWSADRDWREDRVFPPL